MNTIVRRADVGDIPRILELLGQISAFHNEFRPDVFKAEGSKYRAGELAQILSDAARPVFVAESGGRVIGHVLCEERVTRGHPVLVDARVLHVDDLCVDGCVRGKGVGRRLLDAAIAYARDECFGRVELNVWEIDGGAGGFYERAGFRTQKRGMELLLG